MRRSAALSRSGCRLKPAFQAVTAGTVEVASRAASAMQMDGVMRFRPFLGGRCRPEAGAPRRTCGSRRERGRVSRRSRVALPAGGRRSEHTPTGTTGASTGLEAGVHCGIESPGDDLLSHSAAAAVPSALEDFTTVFGMGTGVAPPLGSPGQKMIRSKCGSV